MKRFIELKHLYQKDDSIHVEYLFSKNDVEYVTIKDFYNPIHLLVDDVLPINIQADIINMFNNMDIVIDHEKEVVYKDEKELNEAIQKLDNMIDKYTQYIESYKQMEEAEESNKRIRNMITYIQENKRLPKRLTEKGYRTLLRQLDAILLGLQKRNDRIIILHMIAWLKKIGFTKVYNTENTVYYRFTMPTTYLTIQSDFYCKIEKKGDNYNVNFYYKNFDIKTGKHCMLWEKEQLFHKIEAGWHWYSFPLF
jgi:hypothetical protein